MAPDSTTGLLVDGLVVFLYFAVIIAIGLYKGRGSKDLESFAVGNRNIPWWAVLASILAAEISAATFLGAPGEGYEKRNFTYAQLALGTILARVVIAYIFIKPYYDFRVVSIYEYLLLRFGTRTKNTASAVFLITRALASGTRLYVAAIVFVMGYEMVSGETLNIWQQVWIYIAALSAITALTAVYTALGGIKAVVWTDVIQACIMFGSLGFAIWSLLRAIPGGWQGATAALNQPHDWQFFSSGVEASRTFGENVRSILGSEYTIWAALIGSTFTTLATHGTDQDMVQRMLTAPDIRRSRRSLILSGLADIPIVLTFLTIGLLLWVYYQVHPDPTLPKTSNETFCHFILYQMPVGLRGLLIAGIFATAMGSLSTAINALATSFTRDWYEPYINPQSTAEQSLRAVRWATVWFSILMIIVASTTSYLVIVHPKVRIIPIVLGIFGYTYGSLLGVFLCGMFTKRRGNDLGNIIAMIIGFIVVAILSGLPNNIAGLFGGKLYTQPSWLPVMEFPWWICFGTIVTFSLAILFRSDGEHQPPSET